MTEFQAFKAMLERAGVGHGLRDDHNPRGTAVQVEVETELGDNEQMPTATEFSFNEAGELVFVTSYRID